MKIGLQLYSLREDLKADFEGTLAKVKEMGFDYVELAGGLYDRDAKEIARIMKESGLELISMHRAYSSLLENPSDIEMLRDLGVRFCGLPWMPADQYVLEENFQQRIKDFTKIGQMLKDNGIQLLYHNHDFEFLPYEGRPLLERMLDLIPSDLIQTELDMGWVMYGGQDPAEYLKKFAGRAPLVHLKDLAFQIPRDTKLGPVLVEGQWKQRDVGADGLIYAAVGDGWLNVPEIMRAAEEAGSEFVIVEMDYSFDIPAIDAVKKSREYLRSIGY